MTIGSRAGRETVVVCVEAVRGTNGSLADDRVATEEPLEIRVRETGTPASESRSIAITMRTPGQDAALAVGFLFTEGLVRALTDVTDVQTGDDQVVVTLAEGRTANLARLDRSFAVTSACGVCGKRSLDDLRAVPAGSLTAGLPRLSSEMVHRLPAALRDAQATFATTGGLHAAGLFDDQGCLHRMCEDVGRHNAVDKVVGARLLAGEPPATSGILLVSGRASFELVQKALMAQIPVLAAVGAPSSAAVRLAQEGGMTLLGFVRDGRFNIYAGYERITAVHRLTERHTRRRDQ